MQRLIIFEGPDSTGKSEIAKRLSYLLGIPYFKNENEKAMFKQSSFKESLQGSLFLAQFLKQTGHSAIIDRAHGSEFVYSLVFKRETSPMLIGEIDDVYASMRAKIIYCYKDKLEGYKDDLVDVKFVDMIKEGYNRFLKITACDVLRLNTDSNDLDQQIGVIMSWL